jgi:dihydropteroate synthase
MGILNVTPDSFSDGGKYYNYHSAVQQALDMIVAGTDILDIGGESTRPNSDPVSPEVQLERVIPVIEAIRESSDIPISIDTTSAEVARQALDAGADIINDVSSLRFDEEMVRVAADTGVPLILMHMQGKPKTMQESPSYVSLFSEIIAFLEERIHLPPGMESIAAKSSWIPESGSEKTSHTICFSSATWSFSNAWTVLFSLQLPARDSLEAFLAAPQTIVK